MVCCTKCRTEVLVKDVGCRELSRHIFPDLDAEASSGVVAKDHVRVLVSMPPQISVSMLMQKVKGKTPYTLQREFHSIPNLLHSTPAQRFECSASASS
jgi:putative transposase